jgi:hypothetical protein
MGAGATETLMEIKANNEIRETLFQREREIEKQEISGNLSLLSQ